MTWSLTTLLRPKRRRERDEELRKLRGQLSVAVNTNDRKAVELRRLTASALRLREELDK